MKFTHFFIQRPIFAGVLSLIILIAGAISMWQLPVSEYPEVVPPTVVVRAVYPGANPKTIAETVASPLEQLTDRELQVFRLIGEGNSTRQIAAQLHLSVRTVEAYREYIKTKLNLKNATELVQHAFHWVHHEAAA